MHINNIGYNHCHDSDFIINRPLGSGDNLLILLKSPGIFTFNGVDTVAEANSFILYREGTAQFYRALGREFSNDWFHFSMNDEEVEFIENLHIPFDTLVRIDNIHDLSLFVKNMCYERYSSNMHKEESMELYLKLFFLKLSEKMSSVKNAGDGSYYEKVSILRTQIYNMPYLDWNVEGLAHQLTMSKSYLQHLYKEIFGISVINDVIQSRIEHSKYLLSMTDISIAQIAEMCGYKCELHFMRQFKSRMNITPTQYRKSLAEKHGNKESDTIEQPGCV